MSGSPTDGSTSSISNFSLPDPPQIQKRPRRASFPSRSCDEAIAHTGHSSDCYLVEGSELQPVLMNDWIKMKIEVPKIYLGILYANMLASLFTWLLLAGFVVLPVTFASIRNSHAIDDIGKAGKVVFGAIQNVPFLWVAGTFFVFGVVGLSWLWWENRSNYIWLTDRVFLPALLNSIVGLAMTLANVYTIQGGQWSITAVLTAAATVCITILSMAMYIQYMVWTEPAWKEHRAMNGPHVAQ